MSSEKPSYQIHFEDPDFAPVEVPSGDSPAFHLDVHNSPILFGCRTGICGTCVARVRVVEGTLAGPDDEERECLELVCTAPEPRARLLCQVQLTADIEVGSIGEP